MQPLIEFQEADLGYSRREVIVRCVSLALHRGEFLGVVGPNGSGKTTFLRSLLGLIRPVRGLRRTAERIRFGYVPQRETVDVLFPIPVQEIVLMGRYPRVGPGLPPGRQHRQAALDSLARVGLDHLAERDYAQLSGGQRQRVLIARALAADPDLLVLDEPTHGMDMPSETALLDLLQQLNRDQGLTVVLVSHLLGSVADCAGRIAILTDGRLETGPREEILRSERLEALYGMPVLVREVEGRTAILPGARAHE